MKNIITDNRELLEIIKGLSKPKVGFRRLYRGQTANYPKMLPSSCRGALPGSVKIWDFALSYLYHSTFKDQDSSDLDLIENHAFWFKVLAQHYGPGSPYLDMTNSIDVALWFALNCVNKIEHEFLLSQESQSCSLVKCNTIYFSKHTHTIGWFYVLDVPEWEGKRVPQHGDLLDLSKGPEFVSQCARVMRQHGDLIFGDSSVHGGDLSDFYTCPPIMVARPYKNASFINKPTHFLFPSPSEDSWFNTLLQAPLVPYPESIHGYAYRQSLDVYMVTSGVKEEEVLSLLEKQVEKMPMLIRNRLRDNPDLRKELIDMTGEDAEYATYISFEVPLVLGTPPIAQWNQNILFAGIGERTRPMLETDDEWLPAISLSNVLIQLSPLENCFFTAKSTQARIEAVWLIKQDDKYKFVIFGTFDNKKIEIICLEISYSANQHCFTVLINNSWIPIIDSPVHELLFKTFFLVLDLIRNLSSSIKPDPYLCIKIGDGDKYIGYLPVRGTSLVLKKMKSDPNDMRLHFLRYANTSSVFSGPTLEMPSIATLKLKTRSKFVTFCNLREVYGHVYEIVLNDGNIITPKRSSEGFCPNTADFVLSQFPINIT